MSASPAPQPTPLEILLTELEEIERDLANTCRGRCFTAEQSAAVSFGMLRSQVNALIAYTLASAR